MTAVTDLKAALCQIIATQGLVPTTPLTGAPVIMADGTIQLPVVANSGFVPSGILRFQDGTAERPYLIEATAPGAIALDPARSGGPLLAGHASGALVATNLTTG